MINILMIAHEGMANGASYSLLNLMDTLKGKCHFIVIVPANSGTFIDELSKRNIKVYYVPFERWVKFKDENFSKEKRKWIFRDNHKNQKLAKEMAKILKNEKIDLIHSNTSVIDFGYRLSKLMKKPHIWHIREFGKEDFSMYPLCSDKKYYKKIKDKNNNIICISKAVYEKYENIVSKEKLNIIYNGVEGKNRNDKKKFPLDKKEKMICLQTGMIHKTKGQDKTIKAIEKLRKEGYKNIELWLAGRGNLSSIGIEDLSNKPWLKVLGQVSDMKKLREEVNIEIVSSKKEAFGRVTVEAMMGQIPVIGSNSGGTKELIKDKENGLLFNPDDIEDLKEKIKYFYKNRKEIKRMGENAYKDSKDYYLINRCAEEIYELYEKILKNEELL